jgi:SH3-like domain-containing protein
LCLAEASPAIKQGSAGCCAVSPLDGGAAALPNLFMESRNAGSGKQLRRILLATGVLLGAAIAGPSRDADAQMVIGASGLPIPRFVSLDTTEANMRRGPEERFPIEWVYKRKGWPLQVIGEYGHWRRVRDRDGATGWMHRVLLTGRRTGAVSVSRTTMFEKPGGEGRVIAYLNEDVQGPLIECRPEWCLMSAAGRGGEAEGWVRAVDLWGVLPGETFD